jgi:SH3 domain-containing YSC84-like protein 1
VEALQAYTITLKEELNMKRILLAGTGIALALAISLPAVGATPDEAQAEVVAAGKTLDAFAADKEMAWFREHAKEAKGVFICSKVTKAGFILGGSGGRCVLAVKGEKSWNGPAFYTIGTASIGFQAGVSVMEILVLVNTQKGLDSLMTSDFKMGAGASVSAGPVGTGAGTTLKTDLSSYTRSKGLFAGVDISGSSVKPSEDYNKAYYGKDVTPIDIIVKGAVHNPQAESALLSKIATLFGGTLAAEPIAAPAAEPAPAATAPPAPAATEAPAPAAAPPTAAPAAENAPQTGSNYLVIGVVVLVLLALVLVFWSRSRRRSP